jgi:hypothetical protein
LEEGGSKIHQTSAWAGTLRVVWGGWDQWGKVGRLMSGGGVHLFSTKTTFALFTTLLTTCEEVVCIAVFIIGSWCYY